MASELTEMAGVAEAETESAYAWGLDYDDPDEFPTQRLTPRRITALGIAVSLILITMAGVVALVVVRDANRPEASPPPPSVVETTARPAPPSPTLTPPPPAPLPTVTVTQPPPPPPPPAPSPTRTNSSSTEADFVSTVFTHVPTAWIPGGRPSDVQLLASGYEACRVMAQYGYSHQAATVFYQAQGFNLSAPGGDEWPGAFMSYATMLCNPEAG